MLKLRLIVSILLNLILSVCQLIGGIVSGSSTLISDALHNFSDVISLVISYVSEYFVDLDSDLDKTFGFKRMEIVAALINGLTLFGIALYIFFDAFNYEQGDIDSITVIVLAISSILVNAYSAFILHKDSHENLNIKSAFLHLISDLITSVMVLISGILIWIYNTPMIDLVMSVILGLYLAFISLKLLKEVFDVIMHFTPRELDICDIYEEIMKNEKILNLHKVHLWRLTGSEIHFDAHVEFKDNLQIAETSAYIYEIEDLLCKKFNIKHSTLQVEYNAQDSKELVHK